jgi:hypothetical protein
MKKGLLILFTLLYSVGFAKEKVVFIGLKATSGRTMFNYRYTYNGVKQNQKDKLFYAGAYLNYGTTIKNVSIYSGIGYNLYQYNYNNLIFDTQFNGTGFSQSTKAKRNYSMVSIPVNVDYRVNVYKQKLYFVVGVGTEINITVKSKFKGSDITVSEDLSGRVKPSFALTARTGMLYNINKRFDLFGYFDFSHHLTKYLPYKDSSAYTNKRDGNYPYNLAGSIGVNVKLYKKVPLTIQPPAK